MVLLALALPTFSGGRALAADRSVTDVPYHARADMKMVSDAAILNGSKTLSSASAAFLAPPMSANRSSSAARARPAVC